MEFAHVAAHRCALLLCQRQMIDGIGPQAVLAPIGPYHRLRPIKADGGDIVADKTCTGLAECGGQGGFTGAGWSAEGDGAALPGHRGGMQGQQAPLMQDGGKAGRQDEGGNIGFTGSALRLHHDLPAIISHQPRNSRYIQVKPPPGQAPVGTGIICRGRFVRAVSEPYHNIRRCRGRSNRLTSG